MNTKKLITLALILAGLIGFARSALAQHASPGVKTNTRMLYHDGPVMTGSTDVYVIWYGNWSGDTATTIIPDLLSRIGASPYFMINTTYPDATGAAPNGALIYVGSVYDNYSHGPTLTIADIQDIVADQVAIGGFPLDTTGMYLVIGSADVTDLREDGSTFCFPVGTPPHHGLAPYNGVPLRYGYVGAAARCPTSAGPQFIAPDGSQLPTPNGNFSADAMASTIARLLNVIVTNPKGTAQQLSGWYDRYGLENADKCVGQFGTTYLAPNGARANMRLGLRHYLIQQNWVNDRRGYCALSYP